MPLSPSGGRSSPALQRLIYYSQATARTAAEIEQVLQDVVQASIRHNHDAAVTSFLFNHQGWFLQAIEGPKAAVTATYERICADPRHQTPKIIASRPAEQRCFSAWTLSARRLTAADDYTLALFQQHERFQPARLTARNALALLMTTSQKPAKAILWIN